MRTGTCTARSLLAEGLLDRLNLWMYPVALGTGKRLFDTGALPMAFRPVRPAQVSSSGIMALALEPAGEVKAARQEPPRRDDAHYQQRPVGGRAAGDLASRSCFRSPPQRVAQLHGP